MEPSDRRALADAFARLSDESRYMRFLSHRERLLPDELSYLTEVDHHHHEALLALHAGRIVGVSRYVRDPARPDVGEFSVVVADDCRRRGLARSLVLELGARARRVGIRRLVGTAFSHNRAALALFRDLGASVAPEEGGTVRIELALAGWRLRRERWLCRWRPRFRRRATYTRRRGRWPTPT